MRQHLTRIAGKLWPALNLLDAAEREHRLSELIGILYGTLLFAVGLVWLVPATDLALLRAEWPILLLLLLLAALLNELDFFWIIEYRIGKYDRWSAPLGGLVSTSATLLFGPAAIWLGMVALLSYSLRLWRTTHHTAQRWNVLRNLALNLGSSVLGPLLGLALYQRLGGSFPLPGFSWPAAALAALVVLTQLGVDWLCWSWYLLLVRWTQLNRAGALELGLFAVFEAVAYLPELFAILAAAVYVRVGLAAYLTLIAGALLVGLLAQRLSQAVERSTQRSRELAQLEQLGRALLTALPDASTLPALLAEFVPPMFRYDQIEIRLRPERSLLHLSAQAPAVETVLWDRLPTDQPRAVPVGQQPPWSDRPTLRALAVAPILSIDTAKALGSIYVRFTPTVEDAADALPALQSLASQIASALYRAEEYERALAHQKVIQELTVAAEIQASLLPDRLPCIDGWQLAATLRPARQTSGDFYDLLELPGGRLGLLIADVTDKGTGAALFMALSRTLIRTFAFEYPAQPALALHAANKRILLDSRSSMFVTVFYGILDLATGMLTYANAGHNPPYLLSQRAQPQPLPNTGIPLGILHDATWATDTAVLAPGDTLVLYTDGISEAHNQDAELFTAERLLEAASHCRERGAEAVQAAILAAVERFVEGADQFDDLTLMVVAREK